MSPRARGASRLKSRAFPCAGVCAHVCVCTGFSHTRKGPHREGPGETWDEGLLPCPPPAPSCRLRGRGVPSVSTRVEKWGKPRAVLRLCCHLPSPPPAPHQQQLVALMQARLLGQGARLDRVDEAPSRVAPEQGELRDEAVSVQRGVLHRGPGAPHVPHRRHRRPEGSGSEGNSGYAAVMRTCHTAGLGGQGPVTGAVRAAP